MVFVDGLDLKCHECEHTWHGLVCVRTVSKVMAGGGVITEKCNCPSQFREEE